MTAPRKQNGVLVATLLKGCRNKNRYSDEFAARGMGHRLEEMTGLKLYLYPCDLCRGWHLTKKRKSNPYLAVNYEFTSNPDKTAA